MRDAQIDFYSLAKKYCPEEEKYSKPFIFSVFYKMSEKINFHVYFNLRIVKYMHAKFI